MSTSLNIILIEILTHILLSTIPLHLKEEKPKNLWSSSHSQILKYF